jgi:AraC family transcriptional regulator
MTRTRNAPFNRIVQALVHIQANLDQNLALDSLADQVQLSKFHFHQLFRQATGETPKAYVERLRLEWAALQLRIRQISVLDLALECGYRNHETFSRAFHARFGTSPRDYRKEWFLSVQAGRRARFERAADVAPTPELSPTRIVRLAPMTVGFIRHLGSYERVSPDHFTRLLAWSQRRGGGTPLLLGIARDAPGITPDDKIRFDCCIQVPSAFEPRGDIACQLTPDGEYAVTDYVGSWDMGPAYGSIFERLGNRADLEIIGLPAIEIYRTTQVGQRDSIARVSVAIPVRQIRRMRKGDP